MLVVFGRRMAAVFVLTTVRIGHAAGLYPRWSVFASHAVAAVLLLSASLDPRFIAVFPPWVALLGAVAWVASGRRTDDAEADPSLAEPDDPFARHPA